MIDVILIWSFPDGSPAFVQARNVIVWASFAVDYVARLVLSVGKAMFVRTHKLDQLMVLLPMLRFLCIFLLLRRSLAFVSTEKIAGSIVSIVISQQRSRHVSKPSRTGLDDTRGSQTPTDASGRPAWTYGSVSVS